jgi:SPP1 family predicted phage head-tail adaptor
MTGAGSLDRVIRLQRAVETIDDAGQVSSAWSDLATVRAQVVQDEAIETPNADAIRSEKKITVRVWWRQSFTVVDRILFDGRSYDVRQVLEVGRRRFLELKAVSSN